MPKLPAGDRQAEQVIAASVRTLSMADVERILRGREPSGRPAVLDDDLCYCLGGQRRGHPYHGTARPGGDAE